MATGRSGLGHLRRVATIAEAVKRLSPGSTLQLVTNSKSDNLQFEGFKVFSDIIVAERMDMAQALHSLNSDIAVLDTISVPSVGKCHQKLILILRETPNNQLHHFSLGAPRRWDNVLIPNPTAYWVPELPSNFSHDVNAIGWTYRPSGIRRPDETSTGFVVATGGGGNSATRKVLYSFLDSLFAQVRIKSSVPFKLRQAIGPRAQQGGCLSEADEVFDPGPGLHRVFRKADLVVSTAGYNSVLELATTDTPTLLVAIARTYDDQVSRAEQWGPQLGCCLLENNAGVASDWLVRQIQEPRRRKPVELGPSGEEVAAKLILGVR